MPYSTVTALALIGAELHFGKQGIDVVQVGSQLHLDDSLWDNLDRDIPLRQFVSLLEHLAELSNDSASLWAAGYQYDFTLLGDLGEVLGNSTCLGEALLKLRDFFFLVQNDAHFDLIINERETRIQYKILDTTIWPRRGDAEFTLGLVQQIIDYYVGGKQNFSSFQLEDYSGNGSPLERQINKQFRGFGLYNELVFPTRLLYAKRKSGQNQPDAAIQPIVSQLQKQQSLKKRNTPVAYQVRCAILRKIGLVPIDQTNIADDLGMSRRTLRRRLSGEEFNFQQLLDQCRMQLSIIELTKSDLTFSQIALKTGFSEQSAFTRAFSKWSGMTPSEYQRSHVKIQRPISSK